eukprot:g28.t1
MHSTLESLRTSHEQLEVLEDAIIKQIELGDRSTFTTKNGKKRIRTYQDTILRDHRLLKLLKTSRDKAASIFETYRKDKALDNPLDIENHHVSSSSTTSSMSSLSTNMAVKAFYSQLRDLQNYRASVSVYSAPTTTTTGMEVIPTTISNNNISANINKANQKFIEKICSDQDKKTLNETFSGEEHLGRFIDLHRAFNQFMNLNIVKKTIRSDAIQKTTLDVNENVELQAVQKDILGEGLHKRLQATPNSNLDYIDFIACLEGGFLERFPISLKIRSQAYQKWLQKELLGYLKTFYHKANPLVLLDPILGQTKKDFDALWKKQMVLGWQRRVEHKNTNEGEDKGNSNEKNKKSTAGIVKSNGGSDGIKANPIELETIKS